MKFIVSLALLSIAPLVQAQETANFTGRWRYEKDSGTQRLLEIEQKGRSLRVETAVVSSEGARRLEVRYEIGGPGTTYKGLDGDEFRSAVRWEGNTLVFETVETEAGKKKIPQKTIWMLSKDKNTLQVERASTKSGDTTHSVITYVRQP